MSRRTITLDVAIAAAVMIVVVIISPGLAVVGLIGVIVLILCALSWPIDLALSRRRGRAQRATQRPPRPPARRR